MVTGKDAHDSLVKIDYTYDRLSTYADAHAIITFQARFRRTVV